jgi:ABC-type transport system substrate-binding protein
MRTIALLGGILALAGCSEAPRPNLTGVWKMNSARSRMGDGYSTPAVWVDTIEHKEPELKLKAERKEPDSVNTATYTTDGSETCNVVNGNMVCSKARWDGIYLRIDSTSNYDGVDITLRDRWSLSPDGRTLTIQRRFESAKRNADQLILLEKQ